MKRVLFMVTALICVLTLLSGCGKTCANGCGAKANPKCMAGMCDDCCTYWMGLNGCYTDH